MIPIFQNRVNISAHCYPFDGEKWESMLHTLVRVLQAHMLCDMVSQAQQLIDYTVKMSLSY